MSGIEAAGFVLAAFPLAISALEHYRTTAETLGVFWKIRREYKTWTHSLNICQLAFEQNLEQFLLPLIADENELQRLISEPGSPEWQNPDFETRLRQRLPKSYDLYLESIEHIKEVMNDLKGELGINKPSFQNKLREDDVSFVSKANFEFQTQRIKMSLNQVKRDKLFEALTDYNNELRDLLDTSDRIAALRQSRGVDKRSAVNKGLWNFWRHADRLYSLLTQSWQCDCKRFHQANLFLQYRTTSKAEFRIMFVYAQQNLKPKPWSWTCQETNIKMLEDEWQPKKSTVSFTTSSPTASTEYISTPYPTQTSTAPSPKKSSFRRSIMGKFKKDKADKPKASQTKPAQLSPQVSPIPLIVKVPPPTPKTTVIDTSGPVPNSDEIDMIDVSNLCDTIALYRKNLKHRSCLKGEQCRFALSPLDSQGTSAIHDTISLEQLLSKDSTITLTRRQRYFIAVTLASSHLQLQSTPWIGSQWSKRDIHFPRDSTDPNKIRLDQPYISRSFAPTPSSSHSSSDNTNDHSLSNLGIMLLELCFGTALEDHEIRQKYPPAGHFLDMAAALEWSPRAVEEGGPEFADAILWCLHNMPGSGELDGSLEKWREELYLKVVEPLKYCYDQFSVTAGAATAPATLHMHRNVERYGLKHTKQTDCA